MFGLTHFQTLYFKFKVIRILNRFKGNSKLSLNINTEKKKCFIFLAADYGNLGDVAITYAQKKFLQENYPDYEVVEIPIAQTLHLMDKVKRIATKDDIITTIGGGNMGDMYGDIELLRLMVVDLFRDHRIICFPQTIDYSESEEAEYLMRLSCKIYSQATNVTMCARENISYKTMIELYPTIKVLLTPDIVMGLDTNIKECRDNIVTLCLRKDKEKKDNSLYVEKLMSEIDNFHLSVQMYDTHIGGARYTEEQKYFELDKILKQFSKSKIVITDRLHGMIFAYITGTPAVVLPNSNFKVRACYEWIKNCGHIKFYDEIEEGGIMNMIMRCNTSFLAHRHQSLIQSKLKSII
ncbi:MAG: hypothetical protein HDS67_03205 [Bacteroidales bacterium]|nr:hypothetical protein [Bacteroidales bacterium]